MYLVRFDSSCERLDDEVNAASDCLQQVGRCGDLIDCLHHVGFRVRVIRCPLSRITVHRRPERRPAYTRWSVLQQMQPCGEPAGDMRSSCCCLSGGDDAYDITLVH